jgi:hypothetical protein
MTVMAATETEIVDHIKNEIDSITTDDTTAQSKPKAAWTGEGRVD